METKLNAVLFLLVVSIVMMAGFFFVFWSNSRLTPTTTQAYINSGSIGSSLAGLRKALCNDVKHFVNGNYDEEVKRDWRDAGIAWGC